MGKYIPGNSFLHKLDARTKILASLIITMLIFFSSNVYFLVFILFLSFAMLKISKVKILKFIKSNIVIIFFSFVTTFINLVFEGESKLLTTGTFFVPIKSIKSSLIIFLRLISMITFSSAIMFTTSPNNISSSIEKLLKPLDKFGISSRDIALIITMTLRFVPTLISEAKRTIDAQKSRGANFKSINIFKFFKSVFSVFIPVFVSSINKADDLAIALECRCYDSFKSHTNFKNSKFKKQDIIVFIILLLIVLGVFLCKKN